MQRLRMILVLTLKLARRDRGPWSFLCFSDSFCRLFYCFFVLSDYFVQSVFGEYVVGYILDLPEPKS